MFLYILIYDRIRANILKLYVAAMEIFFFIIVKRISHQEKQLNKSWINNTFVSKLSLHYYYYYYYIPA